MTTEPTVLGAELHTAEAGGRVVRGGAIRALGHVAGMVAALAASVVVLRYLGVAQYGSYIAVMSIIAIVDGLSEAGLTGLGNRDLAVMKTAPERRLLLGDLLGLRLVLTPLATVIAVIVTILLGYPRELVEGTAIAGFSWTLFAISNSIALPLAVELRIGTLAAFDMLKQLLAMISAIVLALAGAGLLPFFATLIPGSLLAIILIPAFASKGVIGPPTFDLMRWRALVRRAMPIAIGAIIGVFYIRLLVILMYQFSSDFETGLFGASARVIEALSGLPLLVFMVALPLLSASHSAKDVRLPVVYQRMIEVGGVFAAFCVTVLFVGSTPIVELIGGSEYEGAAEILRIQSFAMLGTLPAMACLMVAIAIDQRRTIIAANVTALGVAVLVGVPLIHAYDANGAAITAVVGEAVMAALYLVLLTRSGVVRPNLLPLWKPWLAALLAIVIAELTGLDLVLETVIAVVVFAVVIVVTRAVPREVAEAILRRDLPSVEPPTEPPG